MKKGLAMVVAVLFTAAAILAVTQDRDTERKDVRSIAGKILDRDFDSAYDEALTALRTDQSDGTILQLLGQIELERGRTVESVEFLERSLKDGRIPAVVRARALFYLGRAAEKLNKPELAAAHYRELFVLEGADRRTISGAMLGFKRLGRPIPNEMRHKITPRDEFGLEGRRAPDFTLPDVNGVRHSLSEWKGSPIFLHMGTTWCGGCQGEGLAVERFIEKYRDRGLVFLKVNFGEDEAALWDMLDHYRARDLIGLVDFDTRYMDAYKANSWPTTVLIDEKGIIRYHSVEAFYYGENEELTAAVDGLLASRGGPAGEEADCENGACALKPGKKTFVTGDLGPRLAVDARGLVWMSYVSNRVGDNNVYLRCYGKDGRPAAKDVRVSRSLGDDRSPDAAAASDGTIWVTWTSRRGDSYDVFVRSFRNGEASEEVRIAGGTGDAFAPRLAAGAGDSLWITYYRWNFDPETGMSRDRDVFARFYDGKSWGPETEVSPPEPKVEDHTDPDIIVDLEGRAWIAWSYDYHQRVYSKPLNADLPTLFTQKLAGTGKDGGPVFIGVHESGGDGSVDTFPSIAVGPAGDIWCAWDAGLGDRRMILTGRKTASASDFGSEIVASPSGKVCCAPSIVVDRSGRPVLVWRQFENDKWWLYLSRYLKGEWSEAIPVSEAGADAAEPALEAGGDGSVWLAYVERSSGTGKVRLVRLDGR